jgi:threonine/homoserine/homoserine lactone efflux protein
VTDLSYWLLFFSAALALTLSPGPDMIYILSRTTAQGAKAGIAATAGVCSGAFVHVFATALGLSAILLASSAAFTVVKTIGAAYLVYLGVRALRAKGGSAQLSPRATPGAVTSWQAYRDGVLIDVLNPKVAIFFMAFLPQFVRPEAGSTAIQLIVLGTMVIALGFVVNSLLALAAARTIGFFKARPMASTWLNRVFGSLLITLGCRLALSARTG